MNAPAWQPGPAHVLGSVLVGCLVGIGMRWWRRREVFLDEVQVTPEVLDFERRFAGQRRAREPELLKRLRAIKRRGDQMAFTYHKNGR